MAKSKSTQMALQDHTNKIIDYIYIYIYIWCSRNTTYFLKCHLCSGSKLRQMVMAYPFSKCLTTFFWYALSPCYVRMMLFHIENQYCNGLKILSGRISFQYNIKWAWKNLCVAITGSPVVKKLFNSRHIVYISPSHDHNWLYLKTNDQTLARWNYHCHLPEFISTSQVTFKNMGGVSVIPCLYKDEQLLL